VDPTAVVAPIRIERGAGEIARRQGFGALGADGGRFDWVRHLRFNWEAVQNAWYQWVLSYSPERQREMLMKFGFLPDWRTLGWMFAGSLIALLSVLAFFSLRHRTERDPLAELFARFQARLREAGIAVTSHEGPRDLGDRLEQTLAPESRPGAREILQAFERWRYSRASTSMLPREMRQLRRAVNGFRARAA
jgi:acetyl esterase/lipase